MATDQPAHPVTLDLAAPEPIARWRPLVQLLLAIPHIAISQVLQSLRAVLQVIALFSILFTRTIPRGLFDTIVMAYRYEWRVTSYVLWMRDRYPPFEFTPSASDPGGDPATVSLAYPEELRRFMPLVKWFLAIPHYIALAALGLAAVVLLFLAFFAALFTGRFPPGMHAFIVGVSRWALRVRAYVGFMTDTYPPFSLQ